MDSFLPELGAYKCKHTMNHQKQFCSLFLIIINKLHENFYLFIRALIKQQGVPSTEWQIGKTKVFVRSCVHEPLEDGRSQVVNAMAVQIQKFWRGYIVRSGESAVLTSMHIFVSNKSNLSINSWHQQNIKENNKLSYFLTAHAKAEIS
jgi:myosin heavy subunit